MTSLITSLAWVPRGHAAAYPTKYALDEDEYSRIAKSLKLSLDDAKQDLEHEQAKLNGQPMEEEHRSEDEVGQHQSSDSEDEDDEAEVPAHSQPEAQRPGETEDEAVNRIYSMDDYDGSEGDSEDEVDQSIFGTVKSLAYHANGEEDPYLTLPENEESDNEREELQILPIDNLILAARVEDEVAHLECYVYEDESESLYVHHDVMLPAIPLAVEWIGRTQVAGKDDGNLCAVATMEPDIEIWNLDVVDSMYPSAILGLSSNPSNGTDEKRKKKKKSKKANDAYHVDSVLALASNQNHRNLLASSSADKTVKLWDLSTCTAASSYSQHTDKVCALAWHLTQSSVFLSGSYDRTVIASDARAPTAKGPAWGVESDVETVRCDPHNENIFYVGTENGVLHCFDARTLPSSPETSKAVWRLQAHDKALSTFSVNPFIPGFIATGSQDKVTKLWDTQGSSGPSLVTSRDVGVGKIFSLGFAPDAEVGFRLAAAGSKGAVQIWDTSTNRAVRSAFAERAGQVKVTEGKEDKLVSVQADASDEEDEDEEEEADHMDQD